MILMVEERINKLELDVENIKTRLDYKKDEIHRMYIGEVIDIIDRR